MKGRPPGKSGGPARGGKPGGSSAKPGGRSGAPGRARGGAKAASARKQDGDRPFKPGAKSVGKPRTKAPVAKAAAPAPAVAAKPNPAKGVSLDVRQYRVQADDDGIRLDRWFKTHFPGLGFGHLQKLLRSGQIRIDGGRAKSDTRVEPGQVIGAVGGIGEIVRATFDGKKG